MIATPVNIVAALACAARRGVLIKGGAFVELPARLPVIVFDTTGTLTRGQPIVVSVHVLNVESERVLLARAAALAAHNNHPLLRTIAHDARAQGVEPAAVATMRVEAGSG